MPSFVLMTSPDACATRGYRHQRIPLADREGLPAHPPAWHAADHRLPRPRHRGNAHPARMARRLRGGSTALPFPLHRATQTRHPGIGASSQRGRRGPRRRSIHRPHHTRRPDGANGRDAQKLGSAVDPERVRITRQRLVPNDERRSRHALAVVVVSRKTGPSIVPPVADSAIWVASSAP